MKKDNRPWLEWWYYKIVLPKTGDSFYVMYGIVNPWDSLQSQANSGATIGIGDYKGKINSRKHFPTSQFYASYDSTYVSIQDNLATDKRIRGGFKDAKEREFSWDVAIKKQWTFNATSWATGKGLTNIEWYPAQASATCTGTVTMNGREVSFSDAPCYQDRNWGNSFPHWWTWIVSNQFEGHPGTTLAVGGGKPTILRFFKLLEGVTIGLLHKGKTYFFRPNDLDVVKVDIALGKWEVKAVNSRNKIEISAFAPKAAFLELELAQPKGDPFYDYQTLSGTCSVRLYERKKPFVGKWILIDSLQSKYTGIEYGSRKKFDLSDRK